MVDPHSAAVMPSLVRAAVIAVVVMLVAGACGSSSHTSSTKTTSSPSRRTASRQAGSLRLDDIGATAGCAGYGASYVTGVGVHPAQSFLSIVCAPLTGSVTDNGVPGSSLQSDLLRTLRRVPRDAPNQLSIIMWGINDLGWFGDHLGAFQAGLRLLISRLRTSDWNIHTFQDPTLSYAGPWRNLLGAKVTSGDASFVWRSPSGFPGGELAFVTLLRRGIGGRYAFSVDGRRVGEFSTRAAPAPRPARTVNTPGAFRIRVPRGGGHIVRCTITEVFGAANLLGWQLESARPPLVVLVDQPRLPTYHAYVVVHARFVPTDQDVGRLNRAIDAVAREFGSYVIVVHTDPRLGKRAAYFQADGLHPNVLGHAVIAGLIDNAIMHSGHVRSGA